MPYISLKDRQKYDQYINEIANSLLKSENNDVLSGAMNYILFRLAKILCDVDSGGSRSYARMAVVSSAMSEAQAEFRRRIMAPYEDEKIEQNGDVVC